MWRLMPVLLVVGCNGGHAAVPDAPRTDPAVCLAEREAATDRTCSVAADCVVVETADCCGPIAIAVKVGTESAFPQIEATYLTCLACPPLGCAHQIELEDGTPAGSATIVPACISGRCRAVAQ